MTRLIPLGLDGNMDEINALENRVLRGKIKAAIVKKKREQKQCVVVIQKPYTEIAVRIFDL